MASGRNQQDYTDIGFIAVPAQIDGVTILYNAALARGADPTMLDKAVTLSGAGVIALAADGDAVVGKLLQVDSDGFALVQIGRFIKFPGGTSATLTRGAKIVGAVGAASAKGYIRSAASGTAAELVKQRGCIWDASDTTQVIVDFYG